MVDSSKGSSMAHSVAMRYIIVDKGERHISEPSSNNAGLIVLALLMLMPHEEIFEACDKLQQVAA